jgi:hypothetical protein
MRTVTLETWEYEHAAAVGIARFTRNWGRPDAKHYDPSCMEPERNATIAAAACELAVAKATNRYWHAGVWHHRDHWKYRKMADVGSNIEVRRARTRATGAVRLGDTGKVVFAAMAEPKEYRQVRIVGYVEADPIIETFSQSQDMVYLPFEDFTPFGDEELDLGWLER